MGYIEHDIGGVINPSDPLGRLPSKWTTDTESHMGWNKMSARIIYFLENEKGLTTIKQIRLKLECGTTS